MDESLADLLDVLGDREIAVAGELTKMYEEVFRGLISQARTYFEKHPARGEYTLVIAGQSKEAARWTEEQVIAALEVKLTEDIPPSEIARQVAKLSGWKRRNVYQILTDLQDK
jgi:16S rRNA (cytidine1402-2'-O)-methyltransferase